MLVVAVIAPGAMGAAVGRRLAENGVEVRTSLAGRSSASAHRAKVAGMRPVEDVQVAAANIVLSIVPSSQALALAERLAPTLARAARHPVYADCNAVSPQTVQRVGAVIATTGTRFVDAGIIGGPPKPGEKGPVFYTSGADAAALAVLNGHGLRTTPLDGDIGAASGLKMSYAGITKGLIALGSAMMLAATRSGVAGALRAELADSQPQLLAHLTRSVPDMYPKAYRWGAEMEEIAAFAGQDAATRQIYQGIAELYARLAQDHDGVQEEVGALSAFLDQV